MLNVTTSQGNVEISIPVAPAWGNSINVGVKFSAGPNSTILMYMLGLFKRDFRPEVKLIPIFSNVGTESRVVAAQAILAQISTLTGTSFEPLLTHQTTKENMDADQSAFIDTLYNTDVIDCHFMAETINSKTSVALQNHNDRVLSRDAAAPKIVARSTRPFRSIDKAAIAELYTHYNLNSSLLPMTVSCGVIPQDEALVAAHKLECFNCAERLWAFGNV